MSSNVFDPAKVLGCSLEQAQQLMRGHVVTPGEVEAVALQSYRWRAHLRDPESYWVTVGPAADILGVSRAQLRQMLADGCVPFYTHSSGVRLMRRQQIQELARHRRTQDHDTVTEPRRRGEKAPLRTTVLAPPAPHSAGPRVPMSRHPRQRFTGRAR